MFKEYLKLVKFRYHLSFATVILASLYFAKSYDLALLKNIVFVYVSLNLFLYTGLYTLNDIFDRKADMLHPQKKNRPIASGKISVNSALVFVFVCLALGLLFGYFLGKNIFYIYLLFIAFNLFYSLIAKKIPYLELLGNSITHVLRFYLGATLVFVVAPVYTLVAMLLVALGSATERRIVEMKSEHNNARKVLQYYTIKKLDALEFIFFLALLAVTFFEYPNYLFIYLALIAYYIIFVFVINRSKKLNFIFKKIWLK